MSGATQNSPRFNMYSHLIACRFIHTSLAPTTKVHQGDRRGQYDGRLTHVQSLRMGHGRKMWSIWTRTAQPRTPCRDTRARSPDRPISSAIAHRARRTGSRDPAHNHINIATRTRGGDIATAVEAALITECRVRIAGHARAKTHVACY